jgi:succinyl-CoA synthetase beta subunit
VVDVGDDAEVAYLCHTFRCVPKPRAYARANPQPRTHAGANAGCDSMPIQSRESSFFARECKGRIWCLGNGAGLIRMREQFPAVR